MDIMDNRTLLRIYMLSDKEEQPPINSIINGDNKPFAPSGWFIEKHQMSGQMKLDRCDDDLCIDGKKINLYLSTCQQKTGFVEYNNLCKKLEGKIILNANVLDHILARSEQIPNWWKKDAEGNGRIIFFLGTTYYQLDQRESGKRWYFVRYLSYSNRDGWYRGYDNLYDILQYNCFVALLE